MSATVALVLGALVSVGVSYASAPARVQQKPLTGTLTIYAAVYTPAKPTKSNPHPATYLATVVKSYEKAHSISTE